MAAVYMCVFVHVFTTDKVVLSNIRALTLRFQTNSLGSLINGRYNTQTLANLTQLSSAQLNSFRLNSTWGNFRQTQTSSSPPSPTATQAPALASSANTAKLMLYEFIFISERFERPKCNKYFPSNTTCYVKVDWHALVCVFAQALKRFFPHSRDECLSDFQGKRGSFTLTLSLFFCIAWARLWAQPADDEDESFGASKKRIGWIFSSLAYFISLSLSAE